jgi:hypothetical protein
VGVTPRITDDEGGHAVKAQYCDLGTGGLLDDQFSDELVRIEAYATEDWSVGGVGCSPLGSTCLWVNFSPMRCFPPCYRTTNLQTIVGTYT